MSTQILYSPLEHFVYENQIDSLWIKWPFRSLTQPLFHFQVFFVIWIVHRLQQICVTRRSAAILGRTCTPSIQTDWDPTSLLPRRLLLNHDVVLPAITKIVLVLKSPFCYSNGSLNLTGLLPMAAKLFTPTDSPSGSSLLKRPTFGSKYLAR